jgi:hypothetical protein
MEYVPNRISLSSHGNDAADPTHWKLEQIKEVVVLVDVKIALLLGGQGHDFVSETGIWTKL